MRDFTLRNWQDALARVFAKAAIQPAYRETCLRHPREAVAEVSDIDLPAHFKFDFVAKREEIFYSYALPPLQPGVNQDTAREIDDALTNVTEFLLRCTQPTTGM